MADVFLRPGADELGIGGHSDPVLTPAGADTGGTVVIKVGGGRAIGIAGGVGAATVTFSGGGVAATSGGGESFVAQVLLRAGGAIASTRGGGTQSTSVARAGGSTATMAAGGGRVTVRVVAGGGVIDATAGGASFAMRSVSVSGGATANLTSGGAVTISLPLVLVGPFRAVATYVSRVATAGVTSAVQASLRVRARVHEPAAQASAQPTDHDAEIRVVTTGARTIPTDVGADVVDPGTKVD